jgi:hypothetical protein
MFAMSRLDVLVVFQMEQGPHLFISTNNDMTTATTITAIWPSHWYVFLATEMRRSTSSIAGSTVNFYIINEII